MPVVRNTFTDAAGVGLAGFWVETALVARDGFSKDGTKRVVRIHSDLTDANGLWTSPDLPPQSSYAQSGTYYQVTCNNVTTSFDVPDSGGPYNLSDRRRAPVPIDADWKVLPKLVELPDALTMASAADGQVPSYNATTKRFEPVTRVTAQNLADATAALAAKTYVDNADQALSNRVSPLENWKPTVDSSLASKAATTTVNGINDRVTTNTGDITGLKTRVSNLEGGGTGGQAAPLHSGLRGLVTNPSTGAAVDDHTQYHTDARGDARYYKKSDSDTLYAGITHAARHATGGLDPLTPAAIGAAVSNHGLIDHSQDASTQYMYPFMGTTAAASSSSDLRHAMLVTQVGMTNRGLVTSRSARQPIVHDYEIGMNPQVTPGSNEATVFTYDFKTREACDLSVDMVIYGFYSTSGSAPVGATSQTQLTMAIYDMDNGGATLWKSSVNNPMFTMVGYNNYRPINFGYWPARPDTGTIAAKRNLRLRIGAFKDQNAPADTNLYYARGRVTEVAAIGVY